MITNEEFEEIWQVYRDSNFNGAKGASNFVIYSKPERYSEFADKFTVFAEGYLAGKKEKDV